ncbi:MAG: PASTA domain-containing protein [Mogibacterium sp.]|nr:PASTA domain-containing protein [Mogibacterium sp.]
MATRKNKPEKRRQKRRKGADYEYGSFDFNEYGEDAIAVKREKMRRDRDRVTITSLNRRRLVLGFGVIVFLMIALIYRMGYWQIVRADELKTMAALMQTVDTEIDPQRGNIYDSRMSTLAESVTEYELYGYTQYMYKDKDLTATEKAKTVSKLVEITGLDQKTVKEKLMQDENLVLLADGLTREQVEKAEATWGSEITVKTKVARYYPNGAFAAQILGGVSADNVGRSGLEYEYNSVLAGVKGRTVRTTDRDGNTVSGSSTKYYKPQDGKSIVTTIDSVIQNFVESALETGMEETGARAITCIVMDPKTGNILALASTPEYDPNNSSEPDDPAEKKKFDKMTPEEQTDYLSSMWKISAVSDIYEPGSTFKLIAAASALESGSADGGSRYYCDGSIHVGNYNLRCMGVHGMQSIVEAVGNSCNPAMAQVALDMGAETFYSYIDMFGFNDKTGVDLPGETNSIVKSPYNMGDVDLATTGYGQGIAVTPLQILCAVNSLGNHGVLMKPKLVSKIVDSSGNVVEEKEDVAVRQVVSEATADKMCEIMEKYVIGDSGNRAYVPGYRVGGKTGTANFVENSRYADSTNTSYVAMAPMDDPQISMIVIVYSPTKIHYGNFTAGPIVKEIMTNSLQYLGVEPQYTEEEAEEVEENSVDVPDVTGMDSKKAIKQLKYYGLKYIVVPEDNSDKNFVVQDQFPKAGKTVARGSTVYLYSD